MKSYKNKNHEQIYRDFIIPKKEELIIRYVNKKNIFYDFKIIILTFITLLSPRRYFLEKQLKEEAKYFNKLAKNRSKEGMIPITADVRNATFYKPITDYDELVDVGINNIINEPYQSKAIEAICDSPQGKILDVCCGPGWFSLECARKGRDVIGYDISDEAIAIAKSTYEQNKSTDGIGNIDYVNDNAEKQNLDELNISAVVGWSAFHHLADPREFLLKVLQVTAQGWHCCNV